MTNTSGMKDTSKIDLFVAAECDIYETLNDILREHRSIAEKRMFIFVVFESTQIAEMRTCLFVLQPEPLPPVRKLKRKSDGDLLRSRTPTPKPKKVIPLCIESRCMSITSDSIPK